MLPGRLAQLLTLCNGNVDLDADGIDIGMIDFTLSLTPTERLETIDGSLHFGQVWSGAMQQWLGFDPSERDRYPSEQFVFGFADWSQESRP